jgi:hypothetical protein
MRRDMSSGYLKPLTTPIRKGERSMELWGLEVPTERFGYRPRAAGYGGPGRNAIDWQPKLLTVHGLPLRTGIDNRFVVDSILSDRVTLGSFHDRAPSIRRTEVRPICTRRAIRIC